MQLWVKFISFLIKSRDLIIDILGEKSYHKIVFFDLFSTNFYKNRENMDEYPEDNGDDTKTISFWPYLHQIR